VLFRSSSARTGKLATSTDFNLHRSIPKCAMGSALRRMCCRCCRLQSGGPDDEFDVSAAVPLRVLSSETALSAETSRRTWPEEEHIVKSAELPQVPPSQHVRGPACQPVETSVPSLITVTRGDRHMHAALAEQATMAVQVEGSVISQPLGVGSPCWSLIAVQSRFEGCGGTLFADSAAEPSVVCYVGCGLQFGRLAHGSLANIHSNMAEVAVCIAAVEHAMKQGHRRLPFWYLEGSLVGILREALSAQFGGRAHLMESPNRMGMWVRPCGTRFDKAPSVPSGSVLRPLLDTDAALVNTESGPGPNEMDRARVGCWGIEASGTLKGWAVRGADGAIGMLHVDEDWRQRKLGTAIIQRISEEIHGVGKPCFAYIRDDNLPSQRTFRRVGYERVADVKWCCLRFTQIHSCTASHSSDDSGRACCFALF